MTKYASAKKYRLLPPHDVARQRANVGGRAIVGKPGEVLDVDRATAVGLEANGWTLIGPVGVTAERPEHCVPGDAFIDTQAGKTVYYDGRGWRDASGSRA